MLRRPCASIFTRRFPVRGKGRSLRSPVARVHDLDQVAVEHIDVGRQSCERIVLGQNPPARANWRSSRAAFPAATFSALS
jgi:hypothetical protein